MPGALAPPFLFFVLSFEAGLATGLARFLDPLVALAALGGAWWLGRSTAHALLPLTAMAGILVGMGARRSSAAACAAVLPAADVRLEVRLLEPVQSGLAAARPATHRCHGPVTVRVRSDTLIPAGARLGVEGRWIPRRRAGGRPDGLLVARRIIVRPGRGSVPERLRTTTAQASSTLYGARAGLVDALLVGRRGGIDPELHAAFARSGLVHLLSISGFHVGLFFWWVLLILRASGVRHGAASAWAAAFATVYVLWLGWPAPAARAALLVSLGACCRARQRHPSAPALLAVTMLLVSLLDPWALFDLGAWLSLTAFWGSMHFVRWSDHALGTRPVVRLAFGSLGATLGTSPLTAAVLGSVALAGLGLNFAAIPLAALAVPVVLLSLVLQPVLPGLAFPFAAGGGLALGGLERLAALGAAIPGAAVLEDPGLPAAVPWIGILAAALWAVGRRNLAREAARRAGWVLALGGLATLVPFLARPDAGHSGLTLHFLSVGQGDAALIRTPRARWILVDGGPVEQGRDAGRRIVLPYLLRHGARGLALAVVSHAHLDHLGGVPAILGRLPAGGVLEPGVPVAEPSYRSFLELLQSRGIAWRAARAGDSVVVDGVTLLFVHPDTAWAGWGEDLNDDSAVLLVRYGAFEAVLAGDLGVRAESLVARRTGPVELLKVGHHGSGGSSGAPFLAALRPAVAVVSVGRNRYGHPAPGALRRLAAAGADVWRTDREGTVTVRVTDSAVAVRGRRGERRYPLRP